MATPTNIALNLVAQLDKGSIETQAAQMASDMAKAIESAFEGLGQRIARNILSGISTGVRGGLETLQMGQIPDQGLINRLVNQGGMLLGPGGQPAAAGSAPMLSNSPAFTFSQQMGGSGLEAMNGGFLRASGQNLQTLQNADPIVQQARVSRPHALRVWMSAFRPNSGSALRIDARNSGIACKVCLVEPKSSRMP
jgi:hypothetical protein